MPHPPVPLRRLLLREGLLLVAVAGVGLTFGAWWSTRRIMEDQAQAMAEQGLASVCRRLEAGFDEAQRTGEAVARQWREGHGATRLGTLEAERQLLTQLQSRPALCNLTLVDAEGRASAANAPDAGSPDLWLTRGGALLRRWTAEGDLLSEAPDPAAPPDWRDRPWVRQARTEGRSGWTAPYPFLGAVGFGLTYTIPVRTADGAFLGVVGVDLLLGDLGPWLREARPTAGTQVAVLDDHRRLIVPPAPTSTESLERARSVLPEPLSPEDHPLVHAVMTAAKGSPERWTRVEAGGRRYLARLRGLRFSDGAGWQILLAIPEEDLLDHPRKVGAAALAVSLLTLLLLAWRLRRAARKVEAPLAELVAQGAHLLDGTPLKSPDTGIAELQELSHCLRVASLAHGERETLEGQLRQAQRLELVGTLAAGIAHDLGNVLSAVTASVELAQDPRLPDEKRALALERATQATRRAKGFIRALLTLGRPMEHTLASLDLNQPVEGALRLLEPLLGSAIALRAELSPAPLLVMADPLEMEQVILNLGVNARDAMPQGGTLTVSTRRDEAGRAVLEVADTGTGIPASIREKLFTPFATTKEPERGSGLGLAMVQGIAKAHGAQLEVESEEGQGTRFRLRFPLL